MSEDNPTVETPAGEDDEEEVEYEVDYIIKTQMHGRKRFFLVRWKGFGEEADSWEPIDMLTVGAKETVEEFMAKFNAEKKSKAKKRVKQEIDTNAIPPSSPSERGSTSNDDEFTPRRKKARLSGPPAKRAKTVKKSTPRSAAKSTEKSSVATPRVAPAPSRSFRNTSRGLWFMESSPSDDERVDRPSVPKPPSVPTQASPSDDNPAPSSSTAPSIKLTLKRAEPTVDAAPTWSSITVNQTENGIAPSGSEPLPRQSDNEENDRDDEASKQNRKEKKREKKHRRSKIQLDFVACYRPAEDRPLSFVTRQIHPEVVGSNTRIYTLDEAIEIDSQSLSRYLSRFITFSPSGTPVVRPPRRSTSSSYNSD